MYAIIENGSHQFRVREGDHITIDRRPGDPNSEIVFEKVLLLAGDDGAPTIGTPTVAGARVVGRLLQTYRGKKIIIRKFKRRKNYRRKRGHRQWWTSVRITSIVPAG
jgi:large subunit ribosomal protein L21